MGPRAGLHGCGKSLPHQDLIPIPSGLEQVAVLTTLSQPTLHYMNVPYFVLPPLYIYIYSNYCMCASLDCAASFCNILDCFT